MASSSSEAQIHAQIDECIFKTSTANKRNIPEAIFIEKVEGLCKEFEYNQVLARLQELYSKYQYMSSSLLTQRSSLKNKQPDIATALETVQHLVDRRDNANGKEMEYTYQLSENIYSRASVAPNNNVALWLGANCMLEYTLEEAVELLNTNQTNAKTTLVSVEEDMAFLRDQITTTEVNIARTHNYGVKMRQKQKADDTAAGKPDSGAGAPQAKSVKDSPGAAANAPTAGEGKGYTWKQEKGDLEVSVAVPDGANKADVKVTILPDSLKVEHSGVVLVEGHFGGKCSPGGSTWTMNNGRVEITLEKAEATPWMQLFE